MKFTKNVVRATRGVLTPKEMQIVAREKSKSLEYTSLETKDGESFLESELSGEETDLVIGIDTTGDTKGHMYLIVDGLRLDGKSFFFSDTKTLTPRIIENGLVVRYKNIPPEIKKQMIAFLRSKKRLRGITCVAVACKLLFRVGGFAGGPETSYVFPSRFLGHLAREGLQTPEGEILYSEIYSINSDIRKFWINMPVWYATPIYAFKMLRNYLIRGSE